MESNGALATKTEFDLISHKQNHEEPDWSLKNLMKGVQAVRAPKTYLEHCVRLVQKTRTNKHLEMGCGPRATIALVRASQARAFLLGRAAVTLDDLFELAPDVLVHRMRPSLEALAEEKTAADLLNEIMEEFAASS